MAEQLLHCDAALTPRDRVARLFAPAKGYTDVADHERWFAHRADGNAIMRASITDDETAMLDLLRRIRPA